MMLLSTVVSICQQLVKKLRCTLPLPNLFPSLARRFACCQSCSVSAPFGLTALTALRSVLLKNRRLVRKKNILFPFNQIYFLKSRLRSAIKTGKATLKGLGLDGLTEQSVSYKQVGEVNLEVSLPAKS